MPQETTAATYQGFAARFLRWPYQANVMKTFEARSRRTVQNRGEVITVSSLSRQAARSVGAARVETRVELCWSALLEARLALPRPAADGLPGRPLRLHVR